MRRFLKLSSLSAVTLLGFVTSAQAVQIGSAYVGGLLQTDYANFAGDKDDVAKSSADVRRAKLWVKGDLDEDWSYQIGYDARQSELDVSWMGYNGFDVAWLAIGYIDTPSSLNYWSGYTYGTFMEYASPVQAFSPPRGLGLYADAEAANGLVSYQLATYMPDFRDGDSATDIIDGVKYDTTGTDSDELGFAGRAVIKPELGIGDVLHLGASAHYEGISETQEVNPLITTPELLGRSSGTRDNILVSTVAPDAGNIKSSATYGLEAALLWGPFVGQAEYLKTNWTGNDGASDLSFYGYYAQVSYVLTGERRYYDSYSAVIGNVEEIANPYGAWELALRYGYTNLSDDPTVGYTASNDDKTGKQRDWTVGLNWYVTKNVRFQTNYTYAMADYNDSTGRGDQNIKGIGVRGQVAF